MAAYYKLLPSAGTIPKGTNITYDPHTVVQNTVVLVSSFLVTKKTKKRKKISAEV